MRFRAAIRVLLTTTASLIFASLLAFPARAQNTRRVRSSADRLALLPPPAPGARRPARLPNFHFLPARPHDGFPVSRRRMWLALGLAQHGAAFFDARTTRDAMKNHRELDPLLRPFAHSIALYPVMQIAPAGLDWLAIRLATSRHRWLRRLWWLPQAAATAGFVWSGVHNLGLPGPAPR